MVGPLLERSGDGPYRDLAQAMAKATRAAYEKPGASSPPSLIADTIAKAIAAKRPKIRYVVGKMARPMILLRKVFGDRMFDRALMSQVK